MWLPFPTCVPSSERELGLDGLEVFAAREAARPREGSANRLRDILPDGSAG